MTTVSVLLDYVREMASKQPDNHSVNIDWVIWALKEIASGETIEAKGWVLNPEYLRASMWISFNGVPDKDPLPIFWA